MMKEYNNVLNTEYKDIIDLIHNSSSNELNLIYNGLKPLLWRQKAFIKGVLTHRGYFMKEECLFKKDGLL